jgi:hypothetical protein
VFTIRGVHWQPSYLADCETSGFASPARAGFALFSLIYGYSIGLVITWLEDRRRTRRLSELNSRCLLPNRIQKRASRAD